MDNKYQNGKIYKIINSEIHGLVYYGSTIQTLKRRMNKHKSPSNKSCSKALFEYGTPEIILIEDYPCNSRKELCLREGQYHRNNECINKNVAGRTMTEYYIDNKEIISEKCKIYRDINKDKIKSSIKKWQHDNKEKINETSKEYYKQNKDKLTTTIKCDCGSTYQYKEKARHIKSIKHQSFISSI